MVCDWGFRVEPVWLARNDHNVVPSRL